MRHCRISKLYKSEFKRLEISCPLEQNIVPGQIPDTVDGLTPSWAWVQMRQVLMKGSNPMMPLGGIAPAGDMERRIQEHLDSMKD